LSKAVWVVHDGREKVHRLHQSLALREDENGSVLANGFAGKDAGISLPGQNRQYSLQVPWSDLGGSTSGFDGIDKNDLLGHRALLGAEG